MVVKSGNSEKKVNNSWISNNPACVVVWDLYLLQNQNFFTEAIFYLSD